MASINYKMILIEGWVNDRTGHLSDYFYRELKKLEKEFYSPGEAYGNMQEIINQLKKQSERKYYEQLNLWYSYDSQQKARGEMVKMEKPVIENFRQSIPLYFLTDGKYAGHISFEDIEDIENHLTFAYAKIQKEKISDELEKLKKIVGERSNNSDGKPTKLTHLLQLYYEKGCKPLTKPQVEKLAIDKHITKKVLTNKWSELKGNMYSHNGHRNNIKEFLRSYELLMSAFRGINDKALTDVMNHYNQLKETYPDLAY